MKKLLLLLSILFAFSSATPSEQTRNNVDTIIQCHYGQCQATAKSTGNQCKHCVSKAGDLYCWQHR